jgi:hypothetical protein
MGDGDGSLMIVGYRRFGSEGRAGWPTLCLSATSDCHIVTTTHSAKVFS